MEIKLVVKGTESLNGWTAYVAAFKAAHPDAIIDYKMLMQQYIRGVAPLRQE